MPIYQYHCACGNEGEFLLPFNPPSQVCKCGEVMQRKISTYSFVMKQTGNGMALDSLNSGVTGGKRKAWAENHSAAGLEKLPRKYY